MQQRSTQNVMMVSLLAGVTGAALGVLFAPKSGKETRQQLRAKAIDAKAKATATVGKARERMGDKLEKVRDAKERVFDEKTKKRDFTKSPVITAWDQEV